MDSARFQAHEAEEEKETEEHEEEAMSKKCLNDECCCKCQYHVKIEVCNCFGQWPEAMVRYRSKLNKKHGLIGWGCAAFTSDGTVTARKDKHSLCEMFELIGRKQ